MNYLEKYITHFTAFPAHILPFPKDEMKGLAIYIREAYKLNRLQLNDVELLLVEPVHNQDWRIQQLHKHMEILTKMTGRTCVLLLHDVPAYVRERLIAKHINFIIPGKQIYLPGLLIHLKEGGMKELKKDDRKTLTPAAQFLLLYQLLHQREPWQLENHPLKEIAKHTGYAANTITNAARELEDHQLITILGTKEKHLQFKLKGKELWEQGLSEGRLTTPVMHRMYVDVKPENTQLLRANLTALSEYSDMNPGAQTYYAIGKNTYYMLEKENKLASSNPIEGQYCLEVWKYNPGRLATQDHLNNEVVDPLSLYLSMQSLKVERIEMALDHILNTFPW